MSYEENRVRFSKFKKAIPAGDPRLEPVPTRAGAPLQYLHWIAARDFMDLHEAAKKDGFDLRLASGWRKFRFATEDEYNAFVIKRYGSIKEGKNALAFRGAHHLGLAVDFGTEGLKPTLATNAVQLKTPAHTWLKQNAWRYNFTPYTKPRGEAWHWERNMTVPEYESLPGEDGGWMAPAGWAAGLAAAGAGVYWFLRGRKR